VRPVPELRLTGIQPQYLPRLHYFARILHADLFMIQDAAQFVAKHRYPHGENGPSYQAHSPIRHPSGTHLLRVPIRHTGARRTIAETEISYGEDWPSRHVKTIERLYARSPNAKRLIPEITAIIHDRHRCLADLNIATILWGLLRLLGDEHVPVELLTIPHLEERLQETPSFRLKHIRLSSASHALANGSLGPNEKIVALCREAGADEHYCGGTAVAAYLDAALFAERGIRVTVQDWNCTPYHQRFLERHGFVSNLSILDLLLNVPAADAARIIARGA